MTKENYDQSCKTVYYFLCIFKEHYQTFLPNILDAILQHMFKISFIIIIIMRRWLTTSLFE